MYLDVARHMVAFYGRKANLKAGLLHDQGIETSQAIASIPTWMGYRATWRVRCMSVTETSEIVTACKRLQRENWRQVQWELQNRLSTLRLNSTLSAAARPFQLETTSGLALVADLLPGPAFLCGSARECPATTVVIGTPVRRGSPNPQYNSDNEGMSTDTLATERPSHSRCSGRGNRSCHSGSTSDSSHASRVRCRKKDGFSNKI